jgi:hypothetical protein
MKSCKKSNLKQILFVILSFLIIPGCGDPTLPDLSSEEILERALGQMEVSAGFEFSIERTGAFAYLDEKEGVSLKRVTGKFVSPDSFDAVARLITPVFPVDVFIISVDGTQWETNRRNGKWRLSDPDFKFDPSVFFHPETGLGLVLANDLSDIEFVGFADLIELPGKSLYELKAKMDGERMNSFSYGLIDAQMLNVSLWIDPDTFDVHRILIVDPADEGEEEDTNWTIDFWNFNTIFEILPPTLD